MTQICHKQTGFRGYESFFAVPMKLSHQMVFVGEDDRLYTIAGVDLRQDMRHVRFHRRQADEQPVGDFLIGQTVCDFDEDLTLTIGQFIQFRVSICRP